MTPRKTRWVLAVATWATVPQSSGGTPGPGLTRPAARGKDLASLDQQPVEIGGHFPEELEFLQVL